MLKLTQAAAPLALLTLLAGCVPFPNVQIHVPAVSGIVMENGAPVAGAQVHVSGGRKQEPVTAITGPDGRFATAAIREMHFVATLIGDPIFNFTVQVTAGGKTYDGYSLMALGFTPSAVEVRCDLSHPQLKTMSGRPEVCELLTETR